MLRSTDVPVLLVALAAVCGPGAAVSQVPATPPGPGEPPAEVTVRNTMGLTYLHPLTPGVMAEEVVGVRLSYGWGLRPGLSLEASALQAGGKSAILQGGGLGVRLSRSFGPLRVSPAVEVVGGRGIADEGGWWYESEPDQWVYRPFRRPSTTPAVGAGLVTSLEWLHGSGLGAGLTLGYWWLASPAAGGMLMVGGGLRKASHDPEWYWRTSGWDKVPPKFRVTAPAADGEGVYAIGRSGLRLVAGDRSGVQEITVDGVPVALEAAEPGAGDVRSADLPSVSAVAVPPIVSGRHPLHVAVRDGAGNVGEAVVWVTGSTAPALTASVTAPDPALSFETTFTDIMGFARGATDRARVEIGGCAVSTTPAALPGAPARAFRLRVPLDPGTNEFTITIDDPLAGRHVLTHTVTRSEAVAEGRGEPPRITARGARSVSGRSLRLEGRVEDLGRGVEGVEAGGEALPISLDDGGRSSAEFVGYVSLGESGSVDVVGRSLDGRAARLSRAAGSGTRARPTAAALLVGVESYAEDRIRGPADAPGHARALAAALETRGSARLAPEDVRVLADGDATRSALWSALPWLADVSTRVDVVFVYLAGRAVTDAHGQAVGLVPYDVRATYGPGALAWSDLEASLVKLPAEVVVLTDLVDERGDAAPPPARSRCGDGPLPAGGLAVVAAGGRGSFSRRAVELLNGVGVDPTLRLSGLVEGLEAVGGTLRTPRLLADPSLPLVSPAESGGGR